MSINDTAPVVDGEVLRELAKRCEAATGPDRELDADIAIEVFDGGAAHVDDPRDVTRARTVTISHGALPGNFEVVGFSGVSLHAALAYTASLDAAIRLVPDGHGWEAGDGGYARAVCSKPTKSFWSRNCATTALALTAACLRARASLTDSLCGGER